MFIKKVCTYIWIIQEMVVTKDAFMVMRKRT